MIGRDRMKNEILNTDVFFRSTIVVTFGYLWFDY